MTKAERNRDEFDNFMEGEPVEYEVTGLWERRAYHVDLKVLHDTMDRITCSFPFECETIFVENAFGYLITLPRIILEDE